MPCRKKRSKLTLHRNSSMYPQKKKKNLKTKFFLTILTVCIMYDTQRSDRTGQDRTGGANSWKIQYKGLHIT